MEHHMLLGNVEAGTKATRTLSPEELYERVHNNDVDGVDFDFDNMDAAEKESLIMRSTSLGAVMRNFGEEFSSSASGDREFKLSRPCTAIDDFLSHAWNTGRFAKWRCLVYNYHLKASAIAWLVIHLAMILQCHLSAPLPPFPASYKWLCYLKVVLVPTAIQLYIMLYGLPSIPGVGCTQAPTVFLDKLCINQTNAELKDQGIKGLEVFVKRSKRLVLLYDDFTFTRLWCAFESAMFAWHRGGDINAFKLVPIASASFGVIMLFATHIAASVGTAVFMIMLDHRGWDPSEMFRAFKSRDHLILWLEGFAGMIPAYILMGYLVRDRCRVIGEILSTLKGFEMKNTKCFAESDRVIVEARIKELWGDLESFDKFIQEELSVAMQKSVGAEDLAPVWVNLVLGLPWMSMFSMAGLLQEEGELSFFQYILSAVSFSCVLCPFALQYWHLFGFNIYRSIPKDRPNACAFAIGLSTLFNCLFSASVFYEVIMHGFMIQPDWISYAVIGLFFGAQLFVVYYISEVERRNHPGDFTLMSGAVLLVSLALTALTFNYRGASIGCEAWTCIFPHPPIPAEA